MCSFRRKSLADAYPLTAQLPEIFREFTRTAGDPVKAKIIVEAVELDDASARQFDYLHLKQSVKLEQVKRN